VRFRRRWLLAGLLVLVAFLYSQPVRTYLHTRAALARRTNEVRSLQIQRAALKHRLASSLDGPGLLRQARKLGFVKPGERLYIVEGIDSWRRAHRRHTIGRHG
jgi:hypothetical protein